MSRTTICQRCGEFKRHCARNLCQKCYDDERFNGDLYKYSLVGRKRPSKRITAPCTNCGEIELLTLLSGLCKKCYHKSFKRNNIVICNNCGQSRPHDSHGLCNSCATIRRMRDNPHNRSVIICAICGKEKPHHAKGLCAKCYRKEHKRTWKKKIIACEKCGKIKEHMAHGLCASCYLTPEMLRRYRHRKESRERNLLSTLTIEEWNIIFRVYNYSCAYCGIPLENPIQEHWIPASRGGGYTMENIVPSCARCNSRKRSMTGEEYREFLVKEFNYARSYDATP